MADIDIQKTGSGTSAWLWILVAALVIAGIWLFAAAWGNNNERAAATAPAAVPSTTERADLVPVSAISDNPQNYLGRDVAGTATVSNVVSDRAFYVQQDGRQMLVVLDDQLTPATNLDAGEQVQLTGTVARANQASQATDLENLEPRTRQILDQQQAFLMADASSVRILNPSNQTNG